MKHMVLSGSVVKIHTSLVSGKTFSSSVKGVVVSAKPIKNK